MIQVETCRGCGRPLIRHMVGNLTVRLDAIPVDAQTAAAALMAGQGLWRVTTTSVTPAKPAELSALAQRGNVEGPHIAREHACVPAEGPWTRSLAPGSNSPPKAPQGPAGALVTLGESFPASPADLSTPSSAQPTPSSTAQPAVKRRFKRRADEVQVNLIVAMLGATVIEETIDAG